MPPRFPHGLKKDPRKMSRPEIGVFAMLLGSTGLGVYQMATSPWGRRSVVVVQEKEHEEESPQSPTRLLLPSISAPGPVLTTEPPKLVTTVDDGVTNVHFGDPPPQQQR
jgi:hypothetical protein